MNYINIIEIIIKNSNRDLNLVINLDEKKIYNGSKIYELTTDKLNYFFRIIREWKKKYQNKKNINGTESFYINIFIDGNKEIICGDGEYPNNYHEFKEWLEDYYE